MSDSVPERELILAIPITILSIVSFCAASYICASVCMMRKVDKQLNGVQSNLDEYESETFWEKPTLITHHIFWMSFCDAFLGIAEICLWGPKIFGIKFLSSTDTLCSVGGFFIQFTALGSVIWYFVVAWCLFTTVFGLYLGSDFSKLVGYHSICAWTVIILICIIPIFNNEYGAYNNLRNLDSECWVRDPIYYLILYIPVAFTVCFAFFLLVCVWVKFYNCDKRNNGYGEKLRGITIQDSLIVKRLSLFTIVFICVWMPPLLDRLYTVLNNNKNAPFWMTVCHHTALGLIGTCNAVIWSHSKQFHSFAESYQIMNNARKEKTAMEFKSQWNDALL